MHATVGFYSVQQTTITCTQHNFFFSVDKHSKTIQNVWTTIKLITSKFCKLELNYDSLMDSSVIVKQNHRSKSLDYGMPHDAHNYGAICLVDTPRCIFSLSLSLSPSLSLPLLITWSGSHHSTAVHHVIYLARAPQQFPNGMSITIVELGLKI